MEIVRYMALSGVLFSIGVYGALTRRSFAGALMSLSISAGAIALAFVTFNRLIQPTETSGYFFALVVLVLSIAYGVFAAQFVRQDSQRIVEASKREETDSENLNRNSAKVTTQIGHTRRRGEGFVGVVSFTDSFAFQVSVMMVFVVGYVLMKLSMVAALAFVVGVGILTHILYRRRREEQLKKQSTANLQTTMQASVSKI